MTKKGVKRNERNKGGGERRLTLEEVQDKVTLIASGRSINTSPSPAAITPPSISLMYTTTLKSVVLVIVLFVSDNE
jgi:hypothetical protein